VVSELLGPPLRGCLGREGSNSTCWTDSGPELASRDSLGHCSLFFSAEIVEYDSNLTSQGISEEIVLPGGTGATRFTGSNVPFEA